MRHFINLVVKVFMCSFCLFSTKVLSYTFYNDEDITTNSVLFVNENTGTTIFEKNADKKVGVASLTKIMTYIIVAESINDLKRTKILVKPEVLRMVDPDSSLCGLKSGDELTVFDLLHCLMICSGNDSAYVLADYVGDGSVSNFIEMMNSKANDLKCYNTHFVTPDGLAGEDHYSTAWDMYSITKYAINLPYFMEICGKKEYKVFNDDRKSIKTTNKMLNPAEKDYYYPYVKGIKTGYLDEVGRCFISLATKGDTSYICVAIGGAESDINSDGVKKNMAMLETKKLYTWAFENLEVKTFLSRNHPLGQTNLKYAWKKDRLILSPQDDIRGVVPKGITLSDMNIEFSIPDLVKAPVEKGDVIGSAKIKYKDENFKDIVLVSGEHVSVSKLMFIIENLKSIIFSKWTLIILFLLSTYLLFTIVFNKYHKNKKVKNKKIIKE